MAGQSDDAVTDAAGGAGPAPGSRPAGRKIGGARAGQGWLGGLVRPVDYARSRDRYRPPPELYRSAESPARAGCHVVGPGPARCDHAGGPGPPLWCDPPHRHGPGRLRRRALRGGPGWRVGLGAQRARRGRAGGDRRQAAACRQAGRGAAAAAGSGHPRLPAAVGQAAGFADGGPRGPLLLRCQRGCVRWKRSRAVVEHYPVFRIEYAGEAGTRPAGDRPGRVPPGNGAGADWGQRVPGAVRPGLGADRHRVAASRTADQVGGGVGCSGRARAPPRSC